MKFIKPLLIATALMGSMAYANTCKTLYNTNPKSAISVCQKELKQSPNNAELQFYLGYAYYELENYKKAFEWYSKSANQGDADAQYNLAVFYQDGLGVKQDYHKAFEWYTKSANQGHADAQVGLGYLYQEGNGVKQDYRKAIEWYQKATQQDNAVAQYNMGVMYANGYGVKQDDQTAELWFGKACDNGYQDACQYR